MTMVLVYLSEGGDIKSISNRRNLNENTARVMSQKYRNLVGLACNKKKTVREKEEAVSNCVVAILVCDNELTEGHK